MNQSVTSLENLSNELFYEIFDYVDGMHLYQAFSNLNHHFQRLITAPFVLFKIDSVRSSPQSKFIHQWKNMVNFNKHQIYSIDLDEFSDNEEFSTSAFLFDSSFDHLESLHFHNFDLATLLSILAKLPSLPRLFSLYISVDDVSLNLADLYRLIFKLPVLKYYKFFTSELDLPVSLPMATDQQMTQIEYMHINHCCHFNELLNILSYTPQLRQLRFFDDSDGKFNPGLLLSPISLTYLTSLSIRSYSVTFDEWEMFIRHLQPPLKVLYFINRSPDINYLDAHRWERFLRQYFPRLEKFSLRCYEFVNKNERLSKFPFQPNQFLSSFWIERKWLMEIEMEDDEILYSVGPLKKLWHESLLPSTVNSSMELSKSTRLSISLIDHKNLNKFLTKYIKHVLSIAQVYHLDVWIYGLDLKQLIRILDLLPEVVSLKTDSIKFDEETIYSDEDDQIFSSFKEKNKITKVCLEKIKHIREYAIFTTLCPLMAYFKINDINIQDILLGSLCILETINDEGNDRLRLLCFYFPMTDDKLIEILQEIINDQKLSIGYTVKRVLNLIYLEQK